jgi:2-oxoglutarate ferredoxin oxidoreductase subunit alpha
MQREAVQYEAYNTDSDYPMLIVSYGTMSRVCKTAIDMMKSQGFEIGMIRPKTLFPFPESAIQEASARPGCKMALSVEMSMGQMVEDVQRSVLGQVPVHWYGKCGGEVPTPEEICEHVKLLMGPTAN